MTRVAVVTGGNQGIGFAIVRALCKQFDGITYLTARNLEAGTKAIEELKSEGCNARFHQLDITDKSSIADLKSYLLATYGGLDILVNNAGIAYKNDSTAPFSEQAEVTMRTNYWATQDICDQLFPILRSHARVVNVASFGGTYALSKCNAERKQKLLDCQTVEQVNKQMEEFVEATKTGVHEQHGWPNTAYGTTKLGVILLSKIQQANIDKDTSRQDIVINSCCPGYVATNMSSYKGSKTPDQGAETPVYCALLPANISTPRGAFVSDKAIVPVE